MKKKFTARLVASITRTIFAIIIIAIGVLCGNIAMHWQAWCPNNNLGLLVVLALYAGAIMLIGHGIYLLSPIYIGTLVNLLLEEMMERMTIIEEEDDDEEEEEYDEELRKKVIRLRRKYLW